MELSAGTWLIIGHCGSNAPNAGIYNFCINSKALRYKNANVTDWNNVIEIGIYSGNNAANSPVSNAWINAICLSSNSNTKFLHLITFTTNGHIYLRNMLDGKWEAWNLIK